MNIDTLDLSIIKTLLTNRKYALEFVHDCNEKLFCADLWRFAKIVIDYVKIYKECITHRVMIEKVKSQKNAALEKYVEEVFAKIEAHQYDNKEYKHDLEKLKKRYSEKLIVGLKESLGGDGVVDLKKSVGEIQSTLNNIRNINQVKAYDQSTMKDAAEDLKNAYIAKMKDPNFGVGMPTGYSFFDFTTGGLHPSEMLLVGADTGGGKSMLLMNMAINMWISGNTIEMEKDFREGSDILYFSLEMPARAMQERILARIGMIPQKGIRDAKLNDDDKKTFAKSLRFVKQYPWDMEIVDVPRGATIETIELIFNDVCQSKRKPKIVVVDYLSLMEYKGEGANLMDDWLKLGKISEQLSEFARIHEIIMLSAVQLNDPSQGKKAGDNNIGLHRIGRSKMIMHNANFGIQIEKRPNEEQMPDCNLHMIKSRRTELAKGKAFKNYACCALLNDPYIQDPSKGFNTDDISDRISSIGDK